MVDIPRHITAAGRATRFALALLVLPSTTAAVAAELTIQFPRPDSLVAKPSISIRGTAEGTETVSVRVGSDPSIQVPVDDGVWSTPALALPDVLNVVTAKAANREVKVLVTKATSIAARPRQAVVLEWSPEATEELKKIAVGTLLAPLTPQEQKLFADSTKLQTRAIIQSNLSRFGIDVVATAPTRHTIKFLPLSGSLTYGQSPHDCLNQTPSQVSEVWVGTFRQEMVGNLDAWAPMQRTDSLGQRIADVAHALARTASHELGHSLGLVSGSTPVACKWMQGCGLHNCLSFDSQNALADRFADGRYIMDSGSAATRISRIAEKSSQTRGTRVPATFNTLSSDYLLLIHPP